MLKDVFFDLSEYDTKLFWKHVGMNDPRFTDYYEIPPSVDEKMLAFYG
jgi:hypothetical protein